MREARNDVTRFGSSRLGAPARRQSAWRPNRPSAGAGRPPVDTHSTSHESATNRKKGGPKPPGSSRAHLAVRGCQAGTRHARDRKRRRHSTALGIAAIEARHAAVHHHHRRRAAFSTQLGTIRIARTRKRILLLVTSFPFGALLLDELSTGLLDLGTRHQTDGLQVSLDDEAELCDDRRHEFPAGCQ